MINLTRLTMLLLLCLCLLCGLAGCESKTGAAKEPIVTKQIGNSSLPAVEGNDAAESPNPASGIAKPAAVADMAGTVTAVAALAETSKRMPYNPAGKVDPFTPLYKEDAEKKPETLVTKPKEPERPRTPLEKLDLGQLKLTAVITTEKEKRALVEEASGKGYVVEVGTRIGLERGSIVKIGEDRIVIEHEGEDDFGNTTSRQRELKLQKPPGD